MTRKSKAMLRVVTGQGLIPRPKWLERILTAFDTRRTVIEISSLSDEQLKDIGLTRADIQQEVAKSLWDAPSHWRERQDDCGHYRKHSL